MWEVARLVAERGIEGLQVQRKGIVDRAADVSIRKVTLQSVALFHPDRVLVVDVFVSYGHERRHHARHLAEKARVLRGVGLAGALPTRQVPQLHAQYGRLD